MPHSFSLFDSHPYPKIQIFEVLVGGGASKSIILVYPSVPVVACFFSDLWIPANICLLLICGTPRGLDNFLLKKIICFPESRNTHSLVTTLTLFQGLYFNVGIVGLAQFPCVCQGPCLAVSAQALPTAYLPFFFACCFSFLALVSAYIFVVVYF